MSFSMFRSIQKIPKISSAITPHYTTNRPSTHKEFSVFSTRNRASIPQRNIKTSGSVPFILSNSKRSNIFIKSKTTQYVFFHIFTLFSDAVLKTLIQMNLISL